MITWFWYEVGTLIIYFFNNYIKHNSIKNFLIILVPSIRWHYIGYIYIFQAVNWHFLQHGVPCYYNDYNLIFLFFFMNQCEQWNLFFDLFYLFLKPGGGGGIWTHGYFRIAGFQDRCIRPLCHPSCNYLFFTYKE